VFLAELNEMLTRQLGEDGFAGVEIRVTPMRTEIIVRATRTQNVLGTCIPRRPFRPQQKLSRDSF
jgi:small subunit ribosomal protein S3e